MNWKKSTVIVAISIPVYIAAVLVYDAFAVLYGGSRSSISALIIKMSYETPFMVSSVSWFIGLLQGHLFWRMKANDMTTNIDKD